MTGREEQFDAWRQCHSMLPWLPEGKRGRARIVHREITAHLARLSSPPGNPLRPGTYVCLDYAGKTLMSDTDFERETNAPLLHYAHGKVLLGGLGIGLVILPLLEHPGVDSITVVEKRRDVIGLVEPRLRNALQPSAGRLMIVHGDIFRWRPARGNYFNIIYFDIWPMIGRENLEEMKQLHRRYTRYLVRSDSAAWIGSWLYDSLMKGEVESANKGPEPG
ncbi:hypothetical protein HYR69_01960 [Candidatus Sumerlaeota bacterium]|nr:hypothetical protein [Candidatus Sumerlaeota bacterium]MBI3736372.1 hypothetical protein [Candidatus Sumerlaeota bacterium]